MNLNLQRPSGHLGPGYCVANDLASKKCHRATLFQTLYQGSARELCHSLAATH